MWLCFFFGSWYTQYHDYLSVTFRYMRVMIILQKQKKKRKKSGTGKGKSVSGWNASSNYMLAHATGGGKDLGRG